MRKRLVFTFLLSYIVLLISSSCLSPTTTTVTKNAIPTTTPTPKPEGSVLTGDSDWISSDKLIVDGTTYTKVRITAIIQNVGDTGSFYVNADITERELVERGLNQQQIKIFLLKGEQKTFTFDF